MGLPAKKEYPIGMIGIGQESHELSKNKNLVLKWMSISGTLFLWMAGAAKVGATMRYWVFTLKHFRVLDNFVDLPARLVV